MARNDPLSAVNLRVTSQSEQADERQVKNSAGGYTFTLDTDARVRRFLVLGTDGATYYTSAAELTKDNAGVILQKAKEDAKGLTDILLEISLAGRAPKQNPTLFALAVAASLGGNKAEEDRLDNEIAKIDATINMLLTPGAPINLQKVNEYRDQLAALRLEREQVSIRARKYALDALPRIARTGTHLFIFVRYVQQFRGWGKGLRKAISAWYLDKEADQLAYQVVKYRQREGWSHRDLLRKTHAGTRNQMLAPATDEQRALFRWTVGKWAVSENVNELPTMVQAFVQAQGSDKLQDWIDAIRIGVPWEGLPDNALAEKEVWDALIDQGMPMTALIRQLPRLTRLGVTRSRRTQLVGQLTDAERLKKARIHPVNVLVALRTYASGESARGSSTWTPDRHIIDALDEAYYRSFDFVEPTNKRILVALDVSGSMSSPISNMPLSCREAAAAIAMTFLRTERNADIVGFTSGGTAQYYLYQPPTQAEAVTELPISARQRLDDIIRYTAGLDMGRTDCAAPMLWAQKQGRDYDAVLVITDNETWSGAIHPHQALAQYRQRTGLATKMIVLGMTATPFSIADPSDAGSLDIAGFDSAVPTLVSDFIRGL